MAPRKGETVAEKSLRSAQRSEFFATKAKQSAIMACMKVNDSNIWRIHELCLKSGLLDCAAGPSCFSPAKHSQLAIENGAVDSPGGGASSRGVVVSSPAGERGRACPPGDVLASFCGDPDMEIPYSSQYQWCLLSVATLELLLRACLPQIFTVVAVKALCLRGARKKNQDILAAYLEHLTNLMPTANIPKGTTVREAVDIVQRLHANCGHRGRDLILPADWKLQGLYDAFVTSESKLMVAHRGQSKTVTVDGTFHTSTRFYIENNHSELRAVLHQHDGLFQQPLYQYFAASAMRPLEDDTGDVVRDKGCAKRRRLRAEHGSEQVHVKPPKNSNVDAVAVHHDTRKSKLIVAQSKFNPGVRAG